MPELSIINESKDKLIVNPQQFYPVNQINPIFFNPHPLKQSIQIIQQQPIIPQTIIHNGLIQAVPTFNIGNIPGFPNLSNTRIPTPIIQPKISNAGPIDNCISYQNLNNTNPILYQNYFQPRNNYYMVGNQPLIQQNPYFFGYTQVPNPNLMPNLSCFTYFDQSKMINPSIRGSSTISAHMANISNINNIPNLANKANISNIISQQNLGTHQNAINNIYSNVSTIGQNQYKSISMKQESTISETLSNKYAKTSDAINMAKGGSDIKKSKKKEENITKKLSSSKVNMSSIRHNKLDFLDNMMGHKIVHFEESYKNKCKG